MICQKVLLPFIQDLYRLGKWGEMKLMKLNKRKCEVLHLGRNNSVHQYMQQVTQLESLFEEKALGILVAPS